MSGAILVNVFRTCNRISLHFHVFLGNFRIIICGVCDIYLLLPDWHPLLHICLHRFSLRSLSQKRKHRTFFQNLLRNLSLTNQNVFGFVGSPPHTQVSSNPPYRDRIRRFRSLRNCVLLVILRLSQYLIPGLWSSLVCSQHQLTRMVWTHTWPVT